jgi:hypothetical protein
VDKYTHRDKWEGFMKYAAEMCSGAMICIASFIKIVSVIQKMIREIHIQKHKHTDSKVIS